jgi:hypothetical protein
LKGEGEGDIAIDVALVKLVKQDRGHTAQVGVGEQLAEQDALGFELDAGAG